MLNPSMSFRARSPFRLRTALSEAKGLRVNSARNLLFPFRVGSAKHSLCLVETNEADPSLRSGGRPHTARLDVHYER